MIASRRQFLLRASLVAGTSLIGGCGRAHDGIRLGFIVKQPEEQWFQDEWRFAAEAARDRNFALIRIGAENGDRVLSAIDTLYARYAAGFVICTPDPLLGTAIVMRAQANNLKLMSVDDRLIGADGRPIASVPHLGISATAIGEKAGHEAAAEARRRRWDLGEVAVLRIAYDSLETARDRTRSGVHSLLACGISASHVFDAPQRTTDIEGGFTAADPVLTRRQGPRHWIVLGLNDEAVLGGVRAAEGHGLNADAVIGVGIGGSGTAAAEFVKPQPTGFHASVLLSARRHGYDTAAAVYDWVTRGIHPPPVTYTSGELMTRANYRTLLAADRTS